MRERPTGANLLATARAELESRLLPELEGADRHTARMIMRAMDLAMREMAQGAGLDEAEQQGLVQLLAGPVAASNEPAPGASTEDSLAAMNRRLIQSIRNGASDPRTPQHDPVLAHLRAVAKGRLSISQPRLLARPDPDSDR